MPDQLTGPLRPLLQAVKDADNFGLLGNDRANELSGLSGKKTVGALQRLAGLYSEDHSACYAEIGVFQGRTLVAVAKAAPDLSCFGIDDFSILDPEEKNLKIVQKRLESHGVSNAKLINLDFEIALADASKHLLGKKIGVYFIDGPHDYRSQLVALLLAKPLLHDNPVILIDDANYAFVRQATYDFLKSHDEFKLIFEAYGAAHPANMEKNELKEGEKGWLNGINILVRDPGGLLPEIYPPVVEDRTLFVNDWLTHRHQLASLAPEALSLAQAVIQNDPNREKLIRDELVKYYDHARGRLENLYTDRNTFSESLTRGRYSVETTD